MGELEEFIAKTKKVKGPRKHKITNSYGIYDGYKFYRKYKPKEKKYYITESQYFTITRKINNLLAELLANGNEIILPCHMGTLEIRKTGTYIRLENNKIKTNLPIDWNKTLQLWFEDPEAYKNKTIIRCEEKEMFKIFYNRYNATYNNKSYYTFTPNRSLKGQLKISVRNGLDAFKLSKK